MAGIVDFQQDAVNGRAFSMWAEGGLQFRSNLLFKSGDGIPLHAHSYDHVSIVTHGWFAVQEITPSGEVKEYQMASRGFAPSKSHPLFEPTGYRTTILAGHRHTFTLIEANSGPGEVLCIWAVK